jgi:hypothetical protein
MRLKPLKRHSALATSGRKSDQKSLPAGDQTEHSGMPTRWQLPTRSHYFWHRKILSSYVSRADKRYGCSSFGIAIAVNAILKTTTNEKEFGLGFTVNATIVISD